MCECTQNVSRVFSAELKPALPFFLYPRCFSLWTIFFTPWKGCSTAIEICIFADNSHAWFRENSPESLLTGWLRSRVKRGLMFSVFSPLLWAWKNSHIKPCSKLIYDNKCWPPLLLFVFKSHNLINPSVWTTLLNKSTQEMNLVEHCSILNPIYARCHWNR